MRHIETVETLINPGCGRMYAGKEMDIFDLNLVVSARDIRGNVIDDTELS